MEIQKGIPVDLEKLKTQLSEHEYLLFLEALHKHESGKVLNRKELDAVYQALMLSDLDPVEKELLRKFNETMDEIEHHQMKAIKISIFAGGAMVVYAIIALILVIGSVFKPGLEIGLNWLSVIFGFLIFFIRYG